MRNRFAIFLAGMTLAVSACAQSAQPQAQAARGHQHGARLFQRLNLTTDQQAKVQSMRQSERTQIQALRSNTSLTEEQKKQQVRELRKTDRQQLLAVLTPEQQAQLKQMHANRAGRRRAFNAGRRFRALNLTPEQKSQMKPIFQSTRQQVQALRNDTSLTPEQKHEKIQQIRHSQMTQMKSILTPDQQQQLQQWRGRRMHKDGEPHQTPPSA